MSLFGLFYYFLEGVYGGLLEFEVTSFVAVHFADVQTQQIPNLDIFFYVDALVVFLNFEVPVLQEGFGFENDPFHHLALEIDLVVILKLAAGEGHCFQVVLAVTAAESLNLVALGALMLVLRALLIFFVQFVTLFAAQGTVGQAAHELQVQLILQIADDFLLLDLQFGRVRRIRIDLSLRA